MKQDRVITIMGVTLIASGSIMLLTGRFIVGAAFVVIGFIVMKARGTGAFNERSQYEKIVKTGGMTVQDLYEHLKDMDTPLGKPWIGQHVGYPGDSIVFGPSEYRDVIVISERAKKPEFSIKHITKLENITGDPERLLRVKDLKTANVTPKTYSEFAGYKVICTLLLDHMAEIIEETVAGKSSVIPTELDTYNLFYYSGHEGYVSDIDGSRYMRLEGNYSPFSAKTYDADGAELTRIVPRVLDRKGRVNDRAGYDMYSESEHYADVKRTAIDGHDAFVITSGGDEFTATSFAAVLRANIKSNYIIRKNGRIMAVVAGNPNLEFEGRGSAKHYVIMSYDDDYLVLYASFINFVMTLNNFIR